MENIEEYISSGILELYVYGALPIQESEEITSTLKKHPEVRLEVDEIENSLLKLSAATAPYNPESLLQTLKQKLTNKENKSIPITTKTNWPAYVGWAACIVFLVGSFVMYQKNNNLREDLAQQQVKNAKMESQIADARKSDIKTKELLSVLRNKEITKIPLAGQKAAPNAYAAVYWNKKQNKAYIDAKELPDPPRGMVYQVWSLKLNPLAPTSIGLLDNFSQDENKIFQLENANTSEAFGITLEPEGGSKTPTMERLFTMGAVNPS